MWVFIYGLIIVYIYALFGFAFYRELFNAEEGLYCTTLYECSVTMLHRGFIRGMQEVSRLIIHIIYSSKVAFDMNNVYNVVFI